MVENDEHGPSHEEVLGLTTEIVSAYVSNNTMTPDSVSAFIQQIYKTLREMDETAVKSADRPQPAVPVKKSVTPDHIICLEDDKKLMMLKRHLKAAYGMSPEEYRERWDLPADYPMVAPNYAQRRSKLAKDIGLGTRR